MVYVTSRSSSDRVPPSIATSWSTAHPGVPVSRPFVGLGVPLVVRFGPADVGRRVTLRRRLPGAAAGEPSLGDVVGVLERWAGGTLAVRRRTGELVEVPAATLVAGRVVAPELSAEDLDRRADDTWRAREQEALGEWRLRAHGGVTHRPNSALAAGDPGLPPTAAAKAVRAWYAARGLPAAVMAPVASAVADAYRGLGWHEESRTLVMAAELPTLLARAAAAAPARVELTAQVPSGWTDVLARLRDPAVAPLLRELLEGTPGTDFATAVDDDGRALAVARGATSRQWLNVTNVEVVDGARRRGLATAVVAAVARRAAEGGATHAFLQLWPDNTAALRLYERLGFTPHHEYAYFVAR